MNALPENSYCFHAWEKPTQALATYMTQDRLDIVHECIVSSLFLSHGIRRDVNFHAILNGPPNPPMHIQINGETLYDVRTDMETWQQILKKTLAGKTHPGISKDKTAFETLMKQKRKPIKSTCLKKAAKTSMKYLSRKQPLCFRRPCGVTQKSRRLRA